MNITYTKNELQHIVGEWKMAGHTIGFVPTMGALHSGHLELVKHAQEHCSKIVVSIFVNPTQFNDKADLEKYPRTENEDIDLLLSAYCDAVFLPSVSEIYPNDHVHNSIDLMGLDKVMEGKFRPGHFDGVAQVVAELFKIVDADKAFFGKKDFQQLKVIQHMVKQLDMVTEIVACDTVREDDGLAKSSRNIRLTESNRVLATNIYKALDQAKKDAKNHTPDAVKENAIAYLKDKGFNIEYVYIAHPESLEELHENWVDGATMCIAVIFEEVRLIDNMQIY